MASFPFKIVDGGAKKFMDFIKSLRDNLKDESNPILVYGVARLTAQLDNPGIVDIVLRADGNNVVTLRLRVDNLYVIGFRNTANTWFEFRHDNSQGPMIPGSTVLGYNGSYTSNGLSDLNERDPILGYEAVRAAVNGLAGFSGTSDWRTRYWLRTLIVNFIESIRFHAIADRVNQLMTSNPPDTGHSRQLTPREMGLIHNWGSLSEAVRINVSNPATNPFRSFNRFSIFNRNDAVAVLAMALVGLIKNNLQRQRRFVSGNGNDTVGLTLVEVLGVQIKNIDGENPGDLYGSIKVTDSFGSFYMFNQQTTQSVGPGGWVDLAWPNRPITGSDDFLIDLDLKDHDCLSWDDSVAKGQVVWNSRDALSSCYDRTNIKTITGQYGSADVHYAVLSAAVVANVKVVLLDGDGESAPEVYGSIFVVTPMSPNNELRIRLFERDEDNYVQVPVNTAIPLLRKVVSASLYSDLRVEAKLWDQDTLSSDDEIANGSVSFATMYEGTSPPQVITGTYGKVRVEVTWSTSYEDI